MDVNSALTLSPSGCLSTSAYGMVLQRESQSCVHSSCAFTGASSYKALVNRVSRSRMLSRRLRALVELHLMVASSVRAWSLKTDQKKDSEVRSFVAQCNSMCLWFRSLGSIARRPMRSVASMKRMSFATP